jgi:hypothetical protein
MVVVGSVSIPQQTVSASKSRLVDASKSLSPVALTAQNIAAGWMVNEAGEVETFGRGLQNVVNSPSSGLVGVVGIAATSDGKGYWLASSSGEVEAFGNAKLFSPKTRYTGRSIVGIAATSDGKGYWLASSSGEVEAFGNAKLFSPKTRYTGRSIVGIAATSDGQGYWLASSSGEVEAFGNAPAATLRGRLRGSRVRAIAANSALGFDVALADGEVLSVRARHAPTIVREQTTDSQLSSSVDAGYVNPTSSNASNVSVGTTPTTTTSAGTPATSAGTPATSAGTPATSAGTPAAPELTPSATASGPILGAVEPSLSDTALAAASFTGIVIQAGWSTVEPTMGVFSPTAIADLQSQIDAALAAGLAPSLDIGEQYAPQWIFGVGGGTRFEDQFGDIFSGAQASGNDVANAITDTTVRSYLGDYIAYLGAHLQSLASIRLGGGPFNELRYPDGTAGSQPNAFWFYDSSSQSLLPTNVQGWVPGTGTVAQATEFMNTYNSALDSYGEWLVNQGVADFPSSTKIELLMPGWGERPGEVSTAEADLLADPPEEVNEGLDWVDLLQSLPTDGRVVAYSTYADATQGGGSNPDPAAYIHALIPNGVLAGGESTGSGETTTAGQQLMFSDATKWNWYAVNWFFPGQSQAVNEITQAFSTS